ncbi:MAG: leucine-rich repeat domain-containing protein [Bacteroides sp.]|nr:leucine-rich repeat domain-containing protein [Bacteroides sp.]
MKKATIHNILSVCLFVLTLTSVSCKQDDSVGNLMQELTENGNSMISRSEAVIFNITSTETGTLATLMSNAANEKDCRVGDVTELTISGKVSFDDLRTLRSLTRLTKLDLTSITIYDEYGNQCDYLPYGVFDSFASPAHIIIPTSISYIDSPCFASSNIVGITMHNDITSIGSGAFQYCKRLKEVINWPTGVTSIPNSCFWECSSLDFEIPSHITMIEDYAFYSCSSLTDVTIPDGVTKIGANVFHGCSSLTHLTIPSSVTSIGENIVGDCNMLKIIRWNPTIDIPRLFFEWNDCSSLIYAPTGVTSHPDNKYVIIGDETNGYFTEHFELPGNSDFVCPIPFTAETAVYRKYYDRGTIPGVTAGWNTLTLPFDVTKIIIQETGDQPERTLKPFGSDEMGDAKPFWLRTLSDDGFVRSTKIEAGTPYLIAFPNNPSYYLPEYNIWGTIEYWGENVMVLADTEINVVNGPNFDMSGTYIRLKKSMNIYNIDYESFRDDMYGLYFHGGSLFRSSIRATEPFEAYLTNNNGSTRSYIPIEGNGSTRSSGAFNNIPSDNDM